MARHEYGFVLSCVLSDLKSAATFTVSRTDVSSQATSNGLALFVSCYQDTPESASEIQPLVSDTLCLAYCGRVDNRSEIAGALGRPELEQIADGGVLVAAYLTWGSRLPEKVLGEYAFVVFDRRSRRIVAGQDSLGVRRVFYATQGPMTFITSNLALMFQQHPHLRAGFDNDVLPEYFSGLMTPSTGRTIWKGLSELKRGCVLLSHHDRLSTFQAWRPRQSQSTKPPTAREVDEEFRSLVFEGVRASLRARGPLLCDLSGGFDSSTICSVAAAIQSVQSRPDLVAWSYAHDRSDDAMYQDLVCRRSRLPLHQLDFARYPPFSILNLDELPSLGFVQFGAIDAELRRIAADRGIRSRLAGYGADALFWKAFPPLYLSDLLRSWQIRRWSSELCGYVRGGSFSAWHLLTDCSWGRPNLRAGSKRPPLPDFFTPRFRRSIEEAELIFREGDRTFESPARELMYRATLAFVPYPGRVLPDERLPLIYRPLVEFMLNLDWRHIVKPGEERVIMRRALKDALPERLRQRTTKGAHTSPIQVGMRAAWPKLSALLTGERLADMAAVDHVKFRSALERMAAGFPGHNMQVAYTALYLETWLAAKTTVDHKPPAHPVEALPRV